MNPTSIAAIEAADARRVQATLAKDAATLREIFADDLLYVHSSATAEDKATYIERATTGFYDYREMTLLRRSFRDYGDVVVADGDVRIHVVHRGRGGHAARGGGRAAGTAHGAGRGRLTWHRRSPPRCA